MATKYFCDRCDAEIASAQHAAVMVNGDKRNTMDLCSRCVGELHEFFKPLPKDWRQK